MPSHSVTNQLSPPIPAPKQGKKFVRLRLSTKGWKTVKKYGLNKAFAKFDVNLHDFSAQH